MPSYTGINGIRHEFDYHEIELDDMPKEQEGVSYYPVAGYDEEGNKYYTYKVVPAQERLDVITAIKNLTGVEDKEASLIAGIYFRKLSYGEFSKLYDRIKEEANEVTLDRRPVDIVKESLSRIRHALHYAEGARHLKVKLADESLRDLLYKGLEVENKREVKKIDLATEYPNIMERIKFLNDYNKPVNNFGTIEAGKKYYEDNRNSYVKVISR